MNNNWIATYRIQLHAGFPLREAAGIVPYLSQLGISHIYLSPCLQAAPGSLHGYDVADPTRINDELGGDEGWQVLQAAAREHGLKVLLDIVPNHMVLSEVNPWWDDLLAYGPDSQYFEYFDIFPLSNSKRWKICLSVLGEPYGDVLEKKQFSIDLSTGKPRLKYFEQTWPLNIASWKFLLPENTEVKQTFAELSESHGDFIREQIEAISNDPQRMHELVDAQYYRLAWWKLEGEIVNYRRFFNIGTLIGIRVENEKVFNATHQRIQEMISAGELDGVRVDHPDGLHDPEEYFERVRKMIPEGRIFVEKILDTEESLPAEWPVDGTVGYDFLGKLDRLWMDEHKADTLTAAYFDFTGESVNFPALVREKKRQIIDAHFRADLGRMTELGFTIAQSDYHTRDLSPRQIHQAIRALTIVLPVYRTYRSKSHQEVSEIDSKIFKDAFESARVNAPEVEKRVFDFLHSVFHSDLSDPLQEEFVAKWQQLTPAVMAKGAEDTTFYCYDRLVSCNEVGAQPSMLGISTEKFHQFCAAMASRRPGNLLATSTHDNKRSEDVRARISVISEMPDKWASALHEWSKQNEPAWKGRAPDRHAEYLLYQTLVGAWPISKDRCWNYMLKACREAKLATSWHEPNESYEQSIKEFTEGVMDDPVFMKMLAEFTQPLILVGRINSLAQTLIKLTAPGIPDFYQGTELWDLSLVDPDNRRPVNFSSRGKLLEQARQQKKWNSLTDWDSGIPKLWMIDRVLQVRKDFASCFGAEGTYRPLTAQGSKLGHLFGYLRGDRIMVLVPRFTFTLNGKWEDTAVSLPEGTWKNIFTETDLSGDVEAESIFGGFPVALLIKQ
ncbi:MAG: malto-oligosyltrehalose synthase [Chthoniobacterales bacterium]